MLSLAAGVTACGPANDASLDELAATLRSATPADQRTSLESDLDALAALSREKKIGASERQAMVDVFRSVTRDGSIDDDERALLTRLVRDVVSGGGSLAAERPASVNATAAPAVSKGNP
jgi:hypothetical protein